MSCLFNLMTLWCWRSLGRVETSSSGTLTAVLNERSSLTHKSSTKYRSTAVRTAADWRHYSCLQAINTHRMHCTLSSTTTARQSINQSIKTANQRCINNTKSSDYAHPLYYGLPNYFSKWPKMCQIWRQCKHCLFSQSTKVCKVYSRTAVTHSIDSNQLHKGSQNTSAEISASAFAGIHDSNCVRYIYTDRWLEQPSRGLFTFSQFQAEVCFWCQQKSVIHISQLFSRCVLWLSYTSYGKSVWTSE